MHLYRKDPRAGCPRRRSTFVGHVWNGMLTFWSTYKPTPDVSSPNHRPNQHFRSSNKPSSGVSLESHRPNKHIRSTHKPTSGVSLPEKTQKTTSNLRPNNKNHRHKTTTTHERPRPKPRKPRPKNTTNIVSVVLGSGIQEGGEKPQCRPNSQNFWCTFKKTGETFF